MLTVLLVGFAASSSLIIGSVAGSYWKPPQQVIGVALAFASGSLMTALAFELFDPAFRNGGRWIAGGGLAAGALVFVTADLLLQRYRGGVSGFDLLASVTLDGVPENIALGVALIGKSATGVLALLIAIFASNLPEALGGAANMRSQGRSRVFVIGLWAVTGGLLLAAVVFGNVILSSAGTDVLAGVRAFAGGAVLASLASALMPQAYEETNPAVALATAAGFLLTFVIIH